MREAFNSESAGFPPLLGSGIHRLAKFPLAAKRDSPAKVTGERDFRPGSGISSPGSRKRVFPPPRLREAASPNFRLFPNLSKNLWIAGSLHREGRRSPDAPRKSGSGFPPPGLPESGIFAEAGFSESAGFPPLLGSGIRRLQKFPLAGERDSPAGVTGERDFRPGPPPKLQGSGIFPPPRSREAGFSPAGVKCRGLRVTPFYIVPHGWQGF